MYDSYTSPGYWLKLFGLCDGRMDSLITGLQSADISSFLFWGDVNDPLPF